MERKLRIAHFGCGHVSSFTIPDYYVKGGDLVAVFEVNPQIVGRDIGEYLGIGEKGVIVTHADKAREVLEKTKPDICVIATTLSVESIKDTIVMCAKLGIDVVTPTEPAYYPWNNNTRFVAAEIDEIAKKYGITVCATGSPDVTSNNLVSAVLSQTADVKKITSEQLYNVEGEVAYLSEMFGAGLSKEEFAEKFLDCNAMTAKQQQARIDSGEYYPKDGWRICGSIAAQYGWHITSLLERREMLTNDVDINSVTLKKVVKAGDPAGSMNIVTAQTEEGITIEVRFGAKLFAPGEKHMHSWKVEGRPNINCYIEMANTDDEFAVTAAAIVNRIPSVIAAGPGYQTPDTMPNSDYLTKPFHAYVNK